MDSWAGETSALYNQYIHQGESFYTYCSQALLDLLELPPDVYVLDLAGGAGLVSRMLLQRQPTAHITILDASAEQLEHAKHVFGDKVQYVHSRAEQYAPTELFDVVVCANAFWYLHSSVISQIASWLKPGGTLVFNLHEKNSYFKEVSFFSKVNAEVDRMCREQHRTACLMYAPSVDVEHVMKQLIAAGFSIEVAQGKYDEPQENWHVLCELQARRNAPYMAISIDGESKLVMYRQAFRAVTKREEKIERHTLVFRCTKA
jgi:trans-aconitate methyltransferase